MTVESTLELPNSDPEDRVKGALDAFREAVVDLKKTVKDEQKTIRDLLITQAKILTQLRFQWWVIGSVVTLNIGLLWFVASKI